ncbi:MAG: HEAT repeat domain-containing protein [Treponema sp.]|jgi:hypothetical protein|nr:HEAT repeat domain-containing protein [Treponema sp.]
MIKRFSILLAIAIIFASVSWAQSNSAEEMTVEQSYRQEAIEMMLIRETSRVNTREQKMIALEYIGEALNRGSTNPEVRQTLEYLSQEGTRSVARENNRVINNYPDVRRQSAKYLGQIKTEEAKDALIEIIKFDNEPMVLQEAIKALGEIGIDTNGDTIANIAWVVSRFDTLNPDNMIAIATIDAFEKIAKKNGGIKDPAAINLLLRISTGHYVKPVQERAKQLLADMRSFGSTGNR